MINKKGFTLTELLVTMVIFGIVMGLSFPMISRLQVSNKNRKFELYRKSLITSARLYVDAYSKDLFYNKTYAVVSLQDLVDTRVGSDISIDGEDISCNSDDTLIRIDKTDKSYKYFVVLGCGTPDDTGKVVSPKLYYPKDKRINAETGEIIEITE